MFLVAIASPVGAGYGPALCYEQPTLVDMNFTDFRAGRLGRATHFADTGLGGRLGADLALQFLHILRADGMCLLFVVIVVIVIFMTCDFFHPFLELFDALTDGSAHLRQLFGAEDQQRDNENNDEVESVKSEWHGRYPF